MNRGNPLLKLRFPKSGQENENLHTTYKRSVRGIHNKTQLRVNERKTLDIIYTTEF